MKYIVVLLLFVFSFSFVSAVEVGCCCGAPLLDGEYVHATQEKCSNSNYTFFRFGEADTTNLFNEQFQTFC